MQPYDACRLIAVNLLSFVYKPFTKDATFDSGKFYAYTYEAMRLSDDLIDLELEYGFSKSTQSKMRMITSNSTIPFSKIGKYIRYDRVAIDKWLENNAVKEGY